ncbi:hypothetical protein V6N12_038492 [Hibiscus sabdariffa]|uniref:Uncharacterized protein n=1 Tax=Hibiscus sabdariffa TaxID=183260 RepID=A0ABR2BHP0_9ROSI
MIGLWAYSNRQCHLDGYGLHNVHFLHIIFSGPSRSESGVLVFWEGWNLCSLVESRDEAWEGKDGMVGSVGFTEFLCDDLPDVEFCANDNGINKHKSFGMARRLLIASASAGTHRVLTYTLVFSPTGLWV